MQQVVKLADLSAFCKERLAHFSSRELILLQGPLGAGKTQFVKCCVQLLGGEVPDSPTFSLINEYSGARIPIWHVDLYRLSNEADIDSTGFWDLFRETRGLVFVEWPEKVDSDLWPMTWMQSSFKIDFGVQADERVFEFSESVFED